MGAGMPHVIAKGAVWTNLELFYNGALPSDSSITRAEIVERRINAIKNMATPSYTYGGEDGWSGPGSDRADSAFRLSDAVHDDAVKHLRMDWFGSKSELRRLVFGTPAVQSESLAGWENYWGDVEEIFRQTLLMALYVSLGITPKPDEPYVPGSRIYVPPIQPDQPERWTDNLLGIPDDLQQLRCWPIDILHYCGAPWFSGYVTWRNLGTWLGGSNPDSGVVNVQFVTPTQRGQHLDETTYSGNGKPGDSVVNPGSPSHEYYYGFPKQANLSQTQGMHLITHARHEAERLADGTTVWHPRCDIDGNYAVGVRRPIAAGPTNIPFAYGGTNGR